MRHSPDSIRFINARVYRSADDVRPARSLMTRKGVIHWIGDEADAPKADRVIDMQGAAIVPGLTDAHVHLFAIANERQQISLNGADVRSMAEVLDRISDAARKSSAAQWIRAVGFDENNLAEHRYPTRDEIDAAAPDHPVIIRRFCGHTAILNSAALRLLRIDDGISDPPSGSFGRDARGRLDGSAKESAAEAIFRAIPPIDPATMAASLRATIEDSIRMGLTAAVEAAVGFTSGFDDEFAVWNLLRQDASFSPIRLGFMYQLDPKDAAARGLTPRRDPDWQGMTLKFFADGIVGARTAAVSKPFADTGTNGFFMRDEDDLERVIVEAHLDGWQTATHCVGDRASARVISAFEKAERALPGQKPRHRIEHYFVPPEGGLARMKALDALIVTQPSFLTRMRRSILGAFGPDAGRMYPARTVVDAGVTWIGSSDAPTGHVSPWVGMANAVDRGASLGSPIGPDEALSRRQALGSYSYGGAFAMKQEDWRGTLAPGMAADFIAIDRDPFEDSTDIAKTDVLMTVLRGVVRHDTLSAGQAAAMEAEVH
jgi:predicted amidohydrolase YtcJ